jgi:hypothetical protein
MPPFGEQLRLPFFADIFGRFHQRGKELNERRHPIFGTPNPQFDTQQPYFPKKAG